MKTAMLPESFVSSTGFYISVASRALRANCSMHTKSVLIILMFFLQKSFPRTFSHIRTYMYVHIYAHTYALTHTYISLDLSLISDSMSFGNNDATFN